MTIATTDDLAALRAAGRVVADAIAAMRAAVAVGVTTAELDAVAAEVFSRAGAQSAPQLDYDFPGVTCISVNDEAVHGIPGPRRFEDGDMVKLDVTAELHGFYADACLTVIAGTARPEDLELIATAQAALAAGIDAARTGAPVNAIGALVEHAVIAGGASVCRDLMGHGIGRRIHEEPDVPAYFVPELTTPLAEGLVMTIEPIIAAGSGEVHGTADGWTIKTDDASRVAHAEHTLVIRDGAPLILTA